MTRRQLTDPFGSDEEEDGCVSATFSCSSHYFVFAVSNTSFSDFSHGLES